MSVYDGNVARIVTPATRGYQSTVHTGSSTPVHSIHARRERANRRRTLADAVTDPGISSAALRLLLLIQKAGGVLYETQCVIADTLNVSRMTVHRVAKYLMHKGYLLVRRGHPNGYFLNDGRVPEERQP